LEKVKSRAEDRRPGSGNTQKRKPKKHRLTKLAKAGEDWSQERDTKGGGGCAAVGEKKEKGDGREERGRRNEGVEKSPYRTTKKRMGKSDVIGP